MKYTSSCPITSFSIIYFSGHGDVEAKTSTQPGFLLTYDSPPKVYIAGAYPLFYLQLIVQTLSTDKNVQTLVITDACHAGKLAGSNIGGAQATAANLANPAELEKRWKGDTAHGQYPRYLQGAAELLGEKHYMYNYLLAKKLYFEGLDIRLKADRGSTLQLAIEKQKTALVLEPRAAFLYNALGLLYTQLNVSQEAIEYLQKAMEIAPTWGLPHVNICSALARLKRYDEAMEYAYKTIELMPDNSSVYNFLAWFLTQGPWRTEAGFAANVGIDLQQNPTIAWDFMLTAAQRKKAIEFKPDSMTDEQAIRMAEAYLKLGKPEAGKAIFPEKLKSENTRELLAAGKLFWLEMAKYLYVQMKIRQGEKEIAIRLFSEILAKDWFVEYLLFSADRALDPIRQTEPFRRLMRRYFPEKAKD